MPILFPQTALQQLELELGQPLARRGDEDEKTQPLQPPLDRRHSEVPFIGPIEFDENDELSGLADQQKVEGDRNADGIGNAVQSQQSRIQNRNGNQNGNGNENAENQVPGHLDEMKRQN